MNLYLLYYKVLYTEEMITSMKQIPPKVLQTDRLTIDKISGESLEDVLAILCSPAVTQTYMVPDLDKEGMGKLALRFAELSQKQERFVRGIFLNGKLIGLMNDTEITATEIELGWAIHPEYHCRGYCTEAVCAAIAALLEAGFSQVTAGAFECNRASTRVMEKAGMMPIDKTEEISYRGKTHRCVYYASKQEQ